MSTVTLTSLQETAIRRQKDLKILPYAVLREVLGLHGINLMPGIQNKDVLTSFYRKQGILKPYSSAIAITHGDVGKAEEMILQVEKAYASVKDNIQNYKTVAVGPDVLLGKNKSKKHPWEMLMLSSIVKTFGEDIIDALFPAERDTGDQSPSGAFDGFDTLIDTFVAGGKIAIGNGNLVNTFDGVYTEFVAPADADDTEVADRLLEFWRAAHPALKTKNSLLKIPANIADWYDDAYFNKYKHKPIVDEFNRAFLHGTGRKCRIVRSLAMGTGQRIELTLPGNHDFGMDTLGDEAFVQVRYPYEDPNIVQFWIQGDYGTRIRELHQKVYQINEGTPVANALSGDYV
jgi:hypothetical protein